MESLSSPGMRLIQMYTLLLSAPREYSLKRLADIFRCSRQTVLRMIEQLQMVPDIKIQSWMEGKERFYRVRQRQAPPNVSLDIDAIRHLMLCRDIVRHVLPKPLQEEIQNTIGRASVLLPDGTEASGNLDSYAQPLAKGTIDYTPFQSHLEAIQSAMHAKRLCKVDYCPRYGDRVKQYLVAPLRILAFRETLYLRCVVCDAAGVPVERSSRTFAVQRIRRLQALDRSFGEITVNEDDENFGFPFHKPIRVRVAFTQAVATYVSERTWSKDQWIRKRKGGGIVLTFNSTSRNETIAWVLSFGPEAELLDPKEWRQETKEALNEMGRIYG